MSKSPPDLTLPKGGGAIRGIGETFSPDLQTGTGNFSIPIAVPTGRNGFQPQLALAYSTGNGNGAFGLGWSLTIPGVSRKTARGVPRYDDTRDVFVLSGAEDLVPVDRTPTTTRYRPRTEGLFARIEHHRLSGQHDHWEVRSKNGLVSFYGTPGAAGEDPAVVADPARRDHVFAWKLTRTVDPYGNQIVYEYERDSGDEVEHYWDQLYLHRIRYVDYDDDGETKYLVSITFEYDDGRPDPFSDYRAGFEIRTRKRCARIVVATHAEVDRIVRTYELVYLDQRPELRHLLPPNGVSLLSQVRVVGHDGERTEELPPLELGYTRFEPERRRFEPVRGRDLPGRSLADPDLELVDLFGNGLPDVLEMNGSVRYWRNLGDGTFDRPRTMRDAPAGVRLADPGVQLIDADGDGRSDLLVTTERLSGYFPIAFEGGWDRRSFQRYHAAPGFDLEDPEVRLVDLDGDGITDAIRSGSRLECFFNRPERGGWEGPVLVEREALDDFPNVSFSDPRVGWADMTGDGLPSIALVYDGNVEYWPSLGHGRWGRRVVMRGSPRFPTGYDPKRILLGDVDGDGLADLVYVDHNRVTLWLNQSGNRWSGPIVVRGTPPVADADALRLVDLLGIGISGLLWSPDVSSPVRPRMSFLDFTGGVKPYLLNELDNRMGVTTRVEYASSTSFALADAGDPVTRWRTPLPFPVQVVARVEVVDALSGGTLTTTYRYHHGYWDGVEREFRGFGMVEQIDAETFAEHRVGGQRGESSPLARADRPERFAPPTLTKTWFHLGPVDDGSGDWSEMDYRAEYWAGDQPVLSRRQSTVDLLRRLDRSERRDALRTLRGSVLRTELFALDGSDRQDRPYTVVEHLYGIREEEPPGPDEAGRRRIFFPHVLGQRTTQWERGDDPMTTFAFTDEYDAYGQPRTQTNIAVPRGRDFRTTGAAGDPYLAVRGTTTYALRDDDQLYLVTRVAQTTAYEILNDGSQSVFELLASAIDGSAARRVTEQTLIYYDGEPFEGLPLGQIGDFGAPVRTERLVLTDAILNAAYRSDEGASSSPEWPPYFSTGVESSWGAEYPEAFRARVPALAGYTFHDGSDGSGRVAGYFVQEERRCYDWQQSPDGTGRGLVVVRRDPLGNDLTIAHDRFALLPVSTTGPTGLTTRATHDYRVFQPCLIVDPNGNRSAVTFTPLGLVASLAVMGKDGEERGDLPEVPGTRFSYDWLAFAERGQPVSVRTIRRVHHATDQDVPVEERDATIETVEYSDGFGRLLQTRIQAEDVVFDDVGLAVDQSLPMGDVVGRPRDADDPPWVVVSGWQTYDNKGRIVEKYEPFFSIGWEYASPTDAELGQRVTMFYDPRGQVIRTVNPDGSEQRVILGVPDDLADPDRFTPTPWESYTYDANDNAGRTHSVAAADYRAHWNTPGSVVVDALGRIVVSVARNGPNPSTDFHATRLTYDIRGNLLSVSDVLGRVAFRNVYDLDGRALRMANLDAGVSQVVYDAAGNEVERRDDKGALVLHAYDALHRPVALWARDAHGQSVTLRERMVYGDDPDAGIPVADATASNLLGQLVRQYDEAGLLTFNRYDFKGNLLEKERRTIADAALLSAFDSPPSDWKIAPFRVDWQPPAGVTLEEYAAHLLDDHGYRTSFDFDGLSRLTTVRYPRSVDDTRKELRLRYNRAGALERVDLDGARFVEQIAYNAKGQRTLIVYGNGVMTRYAYDPQSFRLSRLRSERFTRPDANTYRPTGGPLQDLAYGYDLVGNVTVIRDRAPASGIPNTLLGPDALDRTYTYDPRYRLTAATGREHDVPPPAAPWDDRSHAADPTRTRAYAERYDYDAEGNLLRLRHQSEGGSFTRTFELVSGGNRLASTTVGEATFDYAYDPAGNLLRETSSRHFDWDYANRLVVFRTQVDGAEPSVYAQYLYDADGHRVKKLVRKQGGQVEVTVYVDGIFEHCRVVQATTTRENNRLHVMDDQTRIAIVRVGQPFPDDAAPEVQYHLADRLGSSVLVLDDTGATISREEYTPYGETSFGSFAKKRYRFSGKERDEESSLYHYGARYYAPWLIRWTSCDPAGMVDGTNLYQYVLSNPLRFVDETGLSHKPDPPVVDAPVTYVDHPDCNPEWQSCVEVVDKNYSDPSDAKPEPPPNPVLDDQRLYMGYVPGVGTITARGHVGYNKAALSGYMRGPYQATVDNIKGGPVAATAATIAAATTGDPERISAAAALGALGDTALGAIKPSSGAKRTGGSKAAASRKPAVTGGGGGTPSGAGKPRRVSAPRSRSVFRAMEEAIRDVAAVRLNPYKKLTTAELEAKFERLKSRDFADEVRLNPTLTDDLLRWWGNSEASAKKALDDLRSGGSLPAGVSKDALDVLRRMYLVKRLIDIRTEGKANPVNDARLPLIVEALRRFP